MRQSMTHGKGNTYKKKKEREKRETYFKFRLIKQYRTSDRFVLVFRLPKKKKGNESTSIRVSRKKTLYKNDEDEEKLEITYFPLSSDGCRRRRCLPLAASGSARRRSISRWPQSSRHRLACSRTSVGTGTSRRRRRAL